MDSTNICILMATYNGAQYVEEQILSIQRQTIANWTLLVRDDGSTDNTLGIVKSLAKKDVRITVLNDSGGSSLGATQNFSQLMQAGLETNSQVFFLCDQDDVWESHKLQAQTRCFPNLGHEPTPFLVHSDLSVVDEYLQLIHPSMISYMVLNPQVSHPFTYLLTRNFVTGCATAGNRRLLEDALPIPTAAIMHDWWLALVAATNGVIEFVGEPLIKYRQHSSNTLGAKGFWQGFNPTGNWLADWRAGNRELLETFYQAQALLEVSCSREDWPSERIVLLQAYTQLLALPTYDRLREIRKLSLRQGNILLQAVFYIRLLTSLQPN